MPRLIWVFAGRIVILLVLSWCGSSNKFTAIGSSLTRVMRWQVLLVSGLVIFSQGSHHHLQLAWLKIIEIILKACNLKSMHGMQCAFSQMWSMAVKAPGCLTLYGLVVFTTECFMLSLALLLVFFSPSLGEERAGLCASCVFVCLFAGIDFCPSLPLGVGKWLQLVIVKLPGLFYKLFCPPANVCWGGGDILFSCCPPIRACIHPSVHLWHFGFSLISWKGNDENSSDFADTLISMRCTFIIEN